MISIFSRGRKSQKFPRLSKEEREILITLYKAGAMTSVSLELAANKIEKDFEDRLKTLEDKGYIKSHQFSNRSEKIYTLSRKTRLNREKVLQSV